MRISTNTLYEIGVARISELQSAMIKTQQQISTNRRILTPADDPIASARALEVTQGKAMNEQFGINRQNARNSLSQEEVALKSMTTLIQDVQTLAVSAGNATLDDEQRKYLATELQGRFEELVGLSNSRDGAGNYIFAGYRVATLPYSANATGATYAGDQGQRMLQVGASRQMPVSDPGSEVFEQIRTGNGTFVTAAGAANAGSGVVRLGSVTDASAITRHDYRIDFHVDAAGASTYDVIDLTAGGTAVSSGNAFKDGDTLAFHGMQFDIKGMPADGDSFTVKPSTTESVFTTLRNLIDTLNQSAKSIPGQAKLSAGLIKGGAELDSMLDNVLSVRASLGARLKELDSLDSAGSDRDLQYAATLSDLQDIDYVKALSEFSQQQTTLEAAQKSFITVSGLSLFKML